MCHIHVYCSVISVITLISFRCLVLLGSVCSHLPIVVPIKCSTGLFLFSSWGILEGVNIYRFYFLYRLGCSLADSKKLKLWSGLLCLGFYKLFLFENFEKWSVLCSRSCDHNGMEMSHVQTKLTSDLCMGHRISLAARDW